MQNSVKDIETSMVAVIGLDVIEVEKFLLENRLPKNEVCEIANDNCPGQVILSGTKKGVEIISEILKDSGARSIINLKVSAPFHSSLMKNASLIMQESLEPIEFKKFATNFISNVTANFEGNLDRIKELLIKQVYSRVRWRESVIKSTEENLKDIVEIGSGKVLSGMNKRIRKDLEIKSISNLGEIDSFFKTYKEIV
jgi:[acyl-carrier-protein] S-malonyltransferase